MSTPGFANLPRLGRVVRLSLAALLATMVLGGVSSSTADAASYPLHSGWDRPFTCEYRNGYRYVTAPTPGMNPGMTSVSGAAESVWWSPDLFRWNGSSWQLWDGTKPWYQALADRNGVIWQQNRYTDWFYGRISVWGVPFEKLPAGWYAVKEYFRWADGSQASVWTRYNLGGTMCEFRT
jgi:hypothetical protein